MKLNWKDLGRVPYMKAWDMQMSVLDSVAEQTNRGTLLVLEHPSCITLGNRGSTDYVNSSAETLTSEGIELVQTSRGGDVTAHNPGQIVMYPILPVKTLGLGPKQLVKALLSSVVMALSKCGIETATMKLDKDAGVWIENDKICAVGIRVIRRVSCHGIALNFDNDLGIFDHIVGCGLVGKGVCRVIDQDHFDGSSRSQLITALVESFSYFIGYPIVESDESQGD
ncbi:MAG: lipoyl(octanoyl) transferase LipB [Pseudobacteriovorax sp.]|nr:lipoyl(octanoyl) transferase LipB [Pseudobacteriovorax sp.]